jgi:hypothetical protein
VCSHFRSGSSNRRTVTRLSPTLTAPPRCLESNRYSPGERRQCDRRSLVVPADRARRIQPSCSGCLKAFAVGCSPRLRDCQFSIQRGGLIRAMNRNAKAVPGHPVDNQNKTWRAHGLVALEAGGDRRVPQHRPLEGVRTHTSRSAGVGQDGDLSTGAASGRAGVRRKSRPAGQARQDQRARDSAQQTTAAQPRNHQI